METHSQARLEKKEKDHAAASEDSPGGHHQSFHFCHFYRGRRLRYPVHSRKKIFTKEALSQFLDAAGFWAPLVFMLVYTAGVCLLVPGTLLTAMGAALFGAYWGFVYVWIGAMGGASVAFWIGRTLG